MLNLERGDVHICLAGHNLVLRPTYEALTHIESEVGIGIVPLVSRFAAQNFSLKDLVAVVTHGLRGAGEPATADKVGDLITKTGILDKGLMEAVSTFLGIALTGSREPTQEAIPVGEPQKQELQPAT